MKKTIVSLSFALLSSVAAFAQFTHYSWIHDLKVRSEPSTEGKVLMRLMEGEGINYANEKSSNTTKITLRNKEYEGAWLKVKTQSNVVGWVHSAGLSDKALNTKMYCWVADLKVRTAADFSASTLAKLAENEQVTFTGKRSEKKAKTTLREVEYNEYWLEIATADGTKGWSHGAGLRYINDAYHDAANPIPKALNTTEARAAWWKGLSKEWKIYFMETHLGYEWGVTPTSTLKDKEIQTLLALTDIDLANDEGCGGQVYSSELKDLSGISQLTQLQSVFLGSMDIKDLHQLNLLKDLKSLYMYGTTYQSLDGIEVFTKLTNLAVAINSDTELKKIAALNGLTDLSLSGKVSSIKPVSYLSELQYLNISSESQNISLEGIEKCTKLTNFSFWAWKDGVSIDASTLKSAKSLTSLTLSTKRFDAQWLPASLKRLYAYGTVFENISAFTNLSRLESLELNTDLENFSSLPVIPSLTYLSINAPQMKSLKGIENFKLLQNLYWSSYDQNLPSSEFLRLKNMPSFKYLSVYGEAYEEDDSNLETLRKSNIEVNLAYDEGGC